METRRQLECIEPPGTIGEWEVFRLSHLSPERLRTLSLLFSGGHIDRGQPDLAVSGSKALETVLLPNSRFVTLAGFLLAISDAEGDRR